MATRERIDLEADDGFGDQRIARLLTRQRDPGERSKIDHRRRRTVRTRTALLAADALGLVVAMAVVQLVVVARFQLRDIAIDALLLAGIVLWSCIAGLNGFYERDALRIAHSTLDDLPDLLLLATLTTWLGLLTLHFTGISHPRLHVAAAFWASALVGIAGARTGARALLHAHRTDGEATIVLGAGHVGLAVARKLASRPEYGLRIVGFIDDNPRALPHDAPPVLGGTRSLELLVRAHGAARVIVAFSQQTGEQDVELFRRCIELGVQVDVVPRLFEVLGTRVQVHDLDGLPLVSMPAPRLTATSQRCKRAFDVVLASLALLALSPLLAYIALRVRLGSPGPVLFRQERMGAGGRPFQIMKFRSMYVDADARKRELEHLNRHTETGPRMFKIDHDPRVTPFGRTLRAWSLDELPQLVNVLRGEMSLVGPRPLILEEDRFVRGRRRRRLDLTPGVTGLWQVLGRSDIPFAEMVQLDYLYVTNWSLWGDLKLMARTIPTVARGRGAY